MTAPATDTPEKRAALIRELEAISGEDFAIVILVKVLPHEFKARFCYAGKFTSKFVKEVISRCAAMCAEVI